MSEETLFGYPLQPGREGYVVLRTLDERDPVTKKRVEDYQHYIVIRECPLCREESRVKVPAQGLWDWEHGKFAQDAFPGLSASEREQVMTGMHPACWDEAFKDEPEEGCPDCGEDTVVLDEELEVQFCTACGWRP